MKWGRWGGWAAHLFDGDVQVCPTKHGLYMRGQSCGPTPPKFDDAPAAQEHGVPYGTVCQKCLKVWNARAKVVAQDPKPLRPREG